MCAGSLGGGDALSPWVLGVERRCRDQAIWEEQRQANRAGVTPAQSRGSGASTIPGSSRCLRGFARAGGRVGTAPCCSRIPLGI